MTYIAASLSDEDIEFIRDAKKNVPFGQNPDTIVHHTVGRFLRNAWSLWDPDTPLKRDAVKTYGIAHADDISGLMMAWVFNLVCGGPFDPQKECERFHKHWASLGTDSLTVAGWPPKEKEDG